MSGREHTIQRVHFPSSYLIHFAVAILLLGAGPALAATFYVDQGNPQASDANSGTQTLPWITILKACQTVVAGDTILVKSGSYTDPGATWEQGFNPVNSGAPGAPIVFRSEPRLAAVLRPPDYPDNATVAMGVQGKTYIVIDGFKAEGQIQMKESSHITIQNCEVTLGRCDVPNDPSINWGISIHTTDSSLVRNNYVHNMRDSGNNSHNTAAIMIYRSNYCVIENNDADCGGGTVFGAYGQKGGGITFNIWRRNIARNGAAGFLGMGSTDNTLYSTDNEYYENIIVNCTQGAFVLDHNTKRYSIYNNTVYNATSLLWADYDNNANTDMHLWNNIVVGGQVGYRRESGTGVDWNALLSSSDYNDFDTPTVAVWNYGSSSYTTLSDWQQATVFDNDSRSTDPSFTNAASGDFHLSQTSSCRGAGLGGVDLGAYPSGAGTVGPDYSTQGSADVIPPSPPVGLRAR